MSLNKNIIDKINKDIDKCVNCKLCFNDCPMMKEYASSPKNLMKDLLNYNVNPVDVSYSCMLCDLCTYKCPKNIDLKSTFYDIRKDSIKNNKKHLRKKGLNVVKFHQINSFSKVFSKDYNLNGEVVFLPGCSLSSYSSDIVNKTYEYLKIHYKDIGITFKCCSKPTLAMGDVNKSNLYYSDLEELIKNNNIKEIIVACPNCYNTISKKSKYVKVTSVYEVISKNKIDKTLINNYKNIEFAVHDSCSVRYETTIHDSIRDILSQLGINVVEFKNNKKDTVCCGSGGMVGVTNNLLTLKQVKDRSNETNCENIVCYCESCCESLVNGGKNILNILDLLFNEDVINKKITTQTSNNTLKKWNIRYKAVKSIKNCK